MNKKRWPQRWTSAAGLGFLYLPIVVVVAYSFNRTRHGAQWGGFTWKWYGELFNDGQVWSALVNTLILAAASTVVSTVLGTALAYAFVRHRWRGQAAVQWMLSVPLFLPDIALAAALLLFFALVRQWTGWFGLGLGAMIAGHITFELPFVAMVVRSRLLGLDPAMEEAARDLGAGTWAVFWNVTLPLVWPGVLAGGLLAFTLSLDDFVVSFFTTGPGATTLPILIYSSVKRGITPEVNALSTLMVAASVAGVLGAGVLQRRRSAGR